jgi:HK97 family phage prohead protease
MPWTYDDPPAVAANWTDSEIERCVDAANAVLQDGGTDEEAIFACIHAAGKSTNAGPSQTREFKTSQQFTKDITDDTVTGIFCVHGNVDEEKDRSHPGAMSDVKIKGRERVRFLWQHNSYAPPIAVVKSIREITRAELPGEVLTYAPDATGGVEVVRKYLDYHPLSRGAEILNGLKEGSIQEMSYAYDILEWSYTTDENDVMIRELKKLALWDISDVNWGMNPATLATSKSANWKARSLADHTIKVEAEIVAWRNRIKELAEKRSKEGRVLSDANRKKVESCVKTLSDALAALNDLLDASEPKQSIDRQKEIRRLYLDTQRTLARLNGVTFT